MRLKLEFRFVVNRVYRNRFLQYFTSGGLEALFGNQKKHEVEIPVTNEHVN